MEIKENEYDLDRCSFCGQINDEDLELLIRGPSVNICDDCVEVCVSIINERRYFLRLLDGIARR